MTAPATLQAKGNISHGKCLGGLGGELGFSLRLSALRLKLQVGRAIVYGPQDPEEAEDLRQQPEFD